MNIRWIAIIALLVCTSAGFAQDDTQPTQEPAPAVVQDMRPIGGAEDVGVSEILDGLSVSPAFHFSQTGETLDSGHSFDYRSSFGGSLEVSRTRNRQRFAMTYTGGGTFTTRTNEENAAYQTLRLSETVGVKRWTFSVFDTVSYTPESTMGGSAGAPGLPPSLLSLLNNTGVASSLQPSQDVLTTSTPRVGNTVAGQIQYNFSYRNSLNVAGTYGMLRFLEREFLNNDQYTGFLDFERMLSPYNTVGVKYAYTAVTYGQIPGAFHTHWFQGMVGRRITNRTHAQLAIGPQLVSGSRQIVGAKNMSWASDLTLNYHRDRYSVSLTGSRHTNAGSGVLLGARTDSGMLNVSRSWLRKWQTSMQGGYARNVGLASTASTYNTRSVGGSINRSISPTLSAYLTYSAQYQTSDALVTSSSSILNGWRHILGVGFQWHPRPLITRQ